MENGSYVAGKGAIVTKQQYDDKGNVIKETDAKGHTSVEIKDAAGLIRSTTDHGDSAQESIATACEYDSKGNQTRQHMRMTHIRPGNGQRIKKEGIVKK